MAVDVKDDPSVKQAMDFVAQSLQQAAQPFHNTTDVQAVKDALQRTLSDLSNQNVISGGENKGFEIGRVGRLWDTWTFKQKAEWLLANKMPVVKGFFEKYRRAIEDYNELLLEVRTKEEDELEDEGLALPGIHGFKELPAYLTRCPRSIVVSDIVVKLNQSIDFVTVNLEIANEHDR